jgi:hypothetical protein
MTDIVGLTLLKHPRRTGSRPIYQYKTNPSKPKASYPTLAMDLGRAAHPQPLSTTPEKTRLCRVCTRSALTYKLREYPGEEAKVVGETLSKGGGKGRQNVVDTEHVLEKLEAADRKHS